MKITRSVQCARAFRPIRYKIVLIRRVCGKDSCSLAVLAPGQVFQFARNDEFAEYGEANLVSLLINF